MPPLARVKTGRLRLGRAVKRAIFVRFRQAALRLGRRKRREAGFVISMKAQSCGLRLHDMRHAGTPASALFAFFSGGLLARALEAVHGGGTGRPVHHLVVRNQGGEHCLDLAGTVAGEEF